MHKDFSSLYLNTFEKPRPTKGHIEEIFSSKVNQKLFELTMKNLLAVSPSYNLEKFYSLNSYGLRSDEFSTSHKGAHVLFAGCSQTFGVGTRLEDLWAYRLYNKMSETKKTSGFFNISVPGASITQIIYQIFYYFKKFGYPDYLFVNFPDFNREISSLFTGNTAKKDLDLEISRSLVLKYKMLKNICNDHGIFVYEMSWYSADWPNMLGNQDLKKYFSEVYFPSNKEMFDHVAKYTTDSPQKEMHRYFNVALDGRHQGIAYQDFWYNKMYQKYKNGK